MKQSKNTFEQPSNKWPSLIAPNSDYLWTVSLRRSGFYDINKPSPPWIWENSMPKKRQDGNVMKLHRLKGLHKKFQKLYPWLYWCQYYLLRPSFYPVTLHKKWSFPLRNSSVNVNKFAGNCGFGHIYWGNP